MPLPPNQSNGKHTGSDGNNTSCCSDKGVVSARREKTQAAQQRVIEAQTSLSAEVHQNHVLRGGGAGKRWQDG